MFQNEANSVNQTKKTLRIYDETIHYIDTVYAQDAKKSVYLHIMPL